MKRLGRWSGLVFVLGCVQCSDVEAPPQQQSSPQPQAIQGEIAFYSELSNRGGYVYVARADGTGLIKLPGGQAWYSKPRWSPDGRRIVVGRTHPDSLLSSIYVFELDNPFRVIKLGEGTDPAWSPDGKKIAFVSNGGLSWARTGVFVMNADGTGLTRLTDPNDPAKCTDGSSASDHRPDWSPDGQKIVFERDFHTNDEGWDCGLDGWGYIPQVHIVNADGSRLRKLTSGGQYAQDSHPAWSPDGRSIVYSDGGVHYLTIIAENGVGPARPVTMNWAYGGGFQLSPAWSPDGKHLLFLNVERPNNDLAIVELATGSVHKLNLSLVVGSIGDASWSPVR